MKRSTLFATAVIVAAWSTACKAAPEAAPDKVPAKPAAAAAPAAAPAKALTPVTSVEGMTEYRLDNGLRVLLFPDDSQAKTTVNIVYSVGSRHEGYGETGMAHLLEHMNFKGTPRHADIWKELRDHGAGWNASTWYDRTNYFETFTASDENLDFALDLEADRMLHSNISAADLAKEFSVVRNEFEKDENDAGRVLIERILSTAYLWHNYGKSTIGSRADIERVPVPALRRFYEKYYQPDNAILVVAGKLDKDKTLALVQKHFGPLPRPTRVLEPTYTVEPAQDGERQVTLRRTGDTQLVGVGYHTVAATDDRAVPLEAVTFLMHDEPTGRLYKALVKTGMASSVDVFNIPLAEPGEMIFIAEVPVGKPLEPVRAKMIEIVEGLAKNPATAEEVERFKARQRKQYDLAFANPESIALGFTTWAGAGDWRLMFVHRDRVDALDAKAVNAAAATFLKQANRTVGTFEPTKAPDRAPLPGTPDVVALVKDYKGKAAMAAGEAFEATLDNIEKRTTRSQLPVGMKLALLPKSTRGQTVRAQLVFHYGTEKDLTGHEEAADFMAELLMHGSKSHTFEQVKSELDRLKAQVSIGGETGKVVVSIQTTRPNLVDTLNLVAEVLETPVFPKEEFDVVKKQAVTDAQTALTDPTALARTAIQRRLQPYPKTDIHYVPTLPEAVDRLNAATLDDVKRLHKTLLGASASEATFVGDFDPAEVKAALDKEYGAWKSPKPFQRVATPYQAVAGAEEKIDTPDKEGGFLLLGANLDMRDDDARYPATFMAGYILGGNSASRFVNRLRQKDGFSYGTSASVSADAIDKRGALVGYALVAPQNAEKAQAAALDEMAKLVKEGVTSDELAQCKAAYAKAFATRLVNDGSVAGMLNRGLYLGRTLDFERQQNAKIEALTPADVAEALKAPVFKPENLIKVWAADKKKAAAQAGPPSTN
jgi:zinc protease